MHRFGLIGKDISYSFSPGYFGEKFRKLGLEDYTYQIFDLADISEFPALFGEYPDLKGLNVTIPYKQVVMPFLDHIAPEAARIGAVNTICLQGSITTGHNTDVTGFRESLRPLLLPADEDDLDLRVAGGQQAADHAVQFAGRIGDAGLGGGAGEFVEVGQFGHGAPSLLFNDFLQSGAKCLTRLDLR